MFAPAGKLAEGVPRERKRAEEMEDDTGEGEREREGKETVRDKSGS